MSRRFQSYDENSPVSRRQRKKKLERVRSQSINDTQIVITEPVPVDSIIADILPDL